MLNKTKNRNENMYISGKRIDEIIKIRADELARLIAVIEKQLTKLPTGRITTGGSKDFARFYYSDETMNIKRKYLKKGDILIEKLAQRKYLEYLLKCSKNEYGRLKEVLNGKEPYPEDAIESIPESLREFVVPICKNDEEYARDWKKETFPTLMKYSEEKKYETDNGEFVRSKSEWIVANLLYKNGIPYKYEKKLVLPDGDFLFPDFTVLNLQTRQEVYIELFGMMGEAKYCSDAIKKINKYAANGIVVGDRLLPIFESQEVPLEIRAVRMTIDRLAMREAA